MEAGLGFSTDAELMGEAASVLLFNGWDVAAAAAAVEEGDGDDVWVAEEAAALL